jgi:hypothetical protein
MAIRTMQPSFSGGEFSPALYSRVDVAKYGNGVKRARNMIVHPQGGISNRPGTRYVATQKATGAIRLVPFVFNAEQAVIIEFGSGYCRFYTNGAPIPPTAPAWSGTTYYTVDTYCTAGGSIYRCIVQNSNKAPATNPTYWLPWSSGIYEIATAYTESELATLKYTQSADVLFITHPSHLPCQLTRYSNASWALTSMVSVNGPFLPTNGTAGTISASGVSGTAVTLTSAPAQFFTGHVGSLWRLEHNIPAQAVNQAIAATGAGTSIQCGSTWRIITSGTWVGTIVIEKSTDGSTWTKLREFSGNAMNVNTYGTVEEHCYIRVNCTAYTSGPCNVSLSSDPFVWVGIVRITAIDPTSYGTIATADVVKPLGSTAATAIWAEGAWSNYRGYPSVSMFYQDRLVFANCPGSPQTIWMSNTGAYTDFGTSYPLVDTDAISVNLASRQLNPIRHLCSLDDIMALTSSSAFSASPSQSGIISPTSISIKDQGSFGSSSVTPVKVGKRLVYVQPMGTVIRDAGYDLTSNSFTGDNLSIFSSHLLKGHTVVAMAYAQEPDSIIYIVRDDGVMITFTYMREQEVVAMTWADTDGQFEDVCVIPANGYDEVWVVVKRGTVRHIERFAPRMVSTHPSAQVFMDCSVSYDQPVLITAMTAANPVVVTAAAHGFSNGDLVDIDDAEGMVSLNGLRFTVANKTNDTFELAGIDGSLDDAYTGGGVVRKATTTITSAVFGSGGALNGKQVVILADGNVLPAQTLASTTLTLPTAASRIHVGLPYVSQVETLKPEFNLGDGTLQDRKIMIPKVSVRFMNTRGGWIGTGENDLIEMMFPGLPVPGALLQLQDIMHEEIVPCRYKKDGGVFFEQRDPLPVTILAIIPQVVPGDR